MNIPFGNVADLTTGLPLRFWDLDNSHYAGFKANATTTVSLEYTWPAAGPAVTGYVLSSTTGGVMSWVAQGAPTGANLTASTGLSITAGSGTAALLVAATLALANTAVTPGTYGSTTQSAVIAIDQQGRITSASNATIASPASFTLTAGAGLGGTTANAVLVAATLTLDLAYAPDWTGFHSHSFPALGVTQDDTKGVLFYNLTAAAVNAQQISPALRFSGQGWKTDATAASQEVSVREWLLPVQGAAAPTGIFKWQAAIAGGAYSDILTVTTAGLLTAPSAAIVGSLNIVGSAGAYGLVITDVSGGVTGLANVRGSIPVGGVLSWTTLAIGTTGKVLTSDGTDASWQSPTAGTAGNPTASVGLSAVNGVATTYMRSDGAPALSVAIIPTWTGIHTFGAGSGIVVTNTTPTITMDRASGTNDVYSQWSLASAVKGYIGISGGTSQFIAGSASGDVCIRGESQSVLIGANGSSFIDLKVASTTGGVSIRSGASTTRMRVGGNLYVNSTDISSAAGGTETDFGTYSFVTNSFSTNGDCGYIEAYGTTSSGVGTATLKFYINGTSRISIVGLTAAVSPWRFSCVITRKSATQIGYVVSGTVGLVATTASDSITVSDLTANALAVKVTGQLGTSQSATEYAFISDFISKGS